MSDQSKQAFMERAIAEKDLNDAFTACFSTPAGQTVLANLATELGLFSNILDEFPHVMSYNEGRRQAVLYILRRLDASERDPLTRFQRMLAQQNDRKESPQ